MAEPKSKARRPTDSGGAATATAPAPFERRKGSRVWTRAGFEGIAYSDGDEAERQLLEILKASRDLSTTSDELDLAIEDWVREAHLSSARSNLLRPLGLKRGQSVLELGAGCGAVTRYLGELGLKVDAVEGSLLRAQCAAERCRDLDNVRVFADQITAFQSDRKYDVVTLIGVLEYSRVFVEGEDPVASCLEIARGHLAEGGVLVLAIENQLGLKYFNGCAEDHLGTAYSGITDLYARKTAVTFGKVELEARLRRSGFKRVDWSFPFPDYKLPTTVISSRGLADAEFAAGDMLVGEFARDYGGSSLRSFDESAVWGVLERNGLLGDFANSFLVVSSLAEDNPLDDGAWLAYRFSPQRLKPFAIRTRFSRRAQGEIVVSKEVVDPGVQRAPVGIDADFRVEQRIGEQPYVRGRLFARNFIDAVGRGYGPGDLAQFLKPWVDYLVSRSTAFSAGDISSRSVPGEYLDCIPTNLIVDAEGNLQPIDLEFVVPGDIPLAWVALRGVVHLATKCFGHRELARATFQEFLDQILPALGFAGIKDWQPYFDLEDSLIRAVLRPWKDRPARGILRARIALPICEVRSLPESHRRLMEIAQADGRADDATHAESYALMGHFAQWLAMLPDPAAPSNPSQGAAAPSQGLIELSDQLALGLEQATGSQFRERIRELASHRARWAALARDNLNLAWALNDANAKAEHLQAVVAAREEALKETALRERELAQTQRREEARAEALKEQVQVLQLVVAAREGELRESTQLKEQLAILKEELGSERVSKTELDAARISLAREEGRNASLKEERDTLRDELGPLRVQLANALERLKHRGAELARAQRHLRESAEQALDRARDPAQLRANGAWPLRLLQGRPAKRRASDRNVNPALAERAARVRESGLFDAAWYARANPDAGVTGDDAVDHYLEQGWQNGRNPNALFHESWYRQENAATLQPGESGLEHYLRIGAAANRPPNPLFDAEWYVNANPDVKAYKPGALVHFLHFGVPEGRDPHPLFDTNWFLREYGAAIAQRDNPLAYFLDNAATTGHSPCEVFDSEWYLSRYPDVEAAGLNPLVHYLGHGALEGRDPSPAFDTKWYIENNPDVARSGINPLVHFRVAGMREGRQPQPRHGFTAPATYAASAAQPVSDGVREWEDYAPLKQRIAAEGLHARGDAQIVPPELVAVAEDEIDVAIARLSFAAHAKPRVSIIIPVFNKLALTLECLQSIANSGSEASCEIIIADDGSSDRSGARLASIPGLVIHRNPENLGFLRNCNSALPLARGEYALLLNNDVQVTPGWLDALLATFSTFERVGAVGPKIVYPSGHLQEAGVALRTDGSVEMVGLNDDPNRERYNYARPVDYVSGACLMLSTELLRELGGFSEDFLPCYCEDSDLCMRIRKRGLRIVYQPSSTVVHHLSRTTADSASDVKLRSVANSLNTFVQKWQEDLDRLAKVRMLAFYLPQFHPIPENDHWWGAGFTEWSNVSRAQPNFVGHYQPRLPADLGYYDLRLPEAMEAQAALARRYGIHGFCAYYYWFAGKRLLEAPVERMLATGRPDIPYCLCWANENWTRRWDGEDHEILIAQKYSPEDDEAVILDLIRHFRGANYIRIDGKPLLLVYRVTMFPDFRATAERWRRICRREGIGDIYLAMVESFDLVHANARPADYNCDASVEFPPLGMAQPRPPSGAVINPDYNGQVADYRDIAARFCARPLPAFTRFRGVMPGWDNTARRQNNSFCFENATPGAFQAWLETAIAQTRAQQHGDERIVFVNAWNEWAEGAYIEPDRRYGHAFLEAVRNSQEADSLLRMNRYALDL